MTQEEIFIEFDKNGNPTIEASGFTGTSCKDATKQLEKVLGAVTDDQKKPEYNKRAEQRQVVRR